MLCKRIIKAYSCKFRKPKELKLAKNINRNKMFPKHSTILREIKRNSEVRY